MKASLVFFFLIAQVFFVLADKKTNDTKVEKRENIEISNVHILSDEKSTEIQRKRDPGYFYNRPNNFIPSRNFGFGRPEIRGRIITKTQSQINRPFKNYGPPNHETPSVHFERNQQASVNGVLNQEAPSPFRHHQFTIESPIASQNNEPFGADTANYLPPKNQKLPQKVSTQFSQIHDLSDNQQFQEQQQLEANQNFFGQNFENQNFGQNEFQNQQISDAALFLTQNAQAISNLYGAPAPNQNYAPNNQEFEQGTQHQDQGQQNQNLQIIVKDHSPAFPNQLPSYASGVLDNQETLENIQSLEKDKIISQLQQALSNRENLARFEHHINSNYQQTRNSATTSIQFPSTNEPQQFGTGEFSLNQQSSSFLPSTTTSSLGYQSYYGPSTPTAPTTPASIPPTSTSVINFQPSGTIAGNNQAGTTSPASNNPRPTISNPGFPQYGGFVPTYVHPTSLIPSVPAYGTTLFPASAIKPVETTPTHFAIPLPSVDVSKPAHLPATIIPPAAKPPSNPSSFQIPTFTIPLAPVRPPQTLLPVQPVQPAVIKPHPAPVIPAATPIHPTYGIHPTIVNPGFVYKPVKVYPVYYYPSVFHRKSVTGHALTHPWNYAPSYTQAKIWK